MGIDTDMKTTFTIHEACDPLSVKLHWRLPNVKSLRVSGTDPDLPCGLSPCLWDFYYQITDEYPTVFEEFPAYSSVLLRLALVNLRTVIVTAAVYRRFGSPLRLATNGSP